MNAVLVKGISPFSLITLLYGELALLDAMFLLKWMRRAPTFMFD
jgi:hypothetical protein